MHKNSGDGCLKCSHLSVVSFNIVMTWWWLFRLQILTIAFYLLIWIKIIELAFDSWQALQMYDSNAKGPDGRCKQTWRAYRCQNKDPHKKQQQHNISNTGCTCYLTSGLKLYFREAPWCRDMQETDPVIERRFPIGREPAYLTTFYVHGVKTLQETKRRNSIVTKKIVLLFWKIMFRCL